MGTLTTILGRTRFRQFREKFYRVNKASPVLCVFSIHSANPAGGITAFVGSSERNEPIVKSLPVLYNRTVAEAIRENFGISQSKSSVIYISPKILLAEFGRWKFTEEETRVTLFDKSYLVEKVHYLGWMYDSCMAVEFTLKSDTKGY